MSAFTNELRKLKIGYVPSKPDLSAPGDRRRFCHYAALRGLTVEVPQPGARYDLVILSSSADISSWSRTAPGKTLLIYDFINSYLDIDPHGLKARLRGPSKYLLGQHAYLDWSYHDSIKRMCRRADAVICSTPEQRRKIESLNRNVHDILDFHTSDARRHKSDYALSRPVNLVWEGLAGNISTFATIAEALERVSRRHPLLLHAVTDLSFRRLNGPVPKTSTRAYLDRTLRGSVTAYLYEWNEAMFATLCTACDIALIPINMDDPLFLAKPENKLLLFWRMGLPTLTAATPAYRRTMAGAGLAMTCAGPAEWEDVLCRYIESERLRREAGERGRQYAERTHGERVLLAKWDRAVASVLGLSTEVDDLPESAPA